MSETPTRPRSHEDLDSSDWTCPKCGHESPTRAYNLFEEGEAWGLSSIDPDAIQKAAEEMIIEQAMEEKGNERFQAYLFRELRYGIRAVQGFANFRHWANNHAGNEHQELREVQERLKKCEKMMLDLQDNWFTEPSKERIDHYFELYKPYTKSGL